MRACACLHPPPLPPASPVYPNRCLSVPDQRCHHLCFVYDVYLCLVLHLFLHRAPNIHFSSSSSPSFTTHESSTSPVRLDFAKAAPTALQFWLPHRLSNGRASGGVGMDKCLTAAGALRQKTKRLQIFRQLCAEKKDPRQWWVALQLILSSSDKCRKRWVHPPPRAAHPTGFTHGNTTYSLSKRPGREGRGT